MLEFFSPFSPITHAQPTLSIIDKTLTSYYKFAKKGNDPNCEEEKRGGPSDVAEDAAPLSEGNDAAVVGLGGVGEAQRVAVLKDALVDPLQRVLHQLALPLARVLHHVLCVIRPARRLNDCKRDAVG